MYQQNESERKRIRNNLKDEFRKMDMNGDRSIKYDELLLHLNQKNVFP
jgi:Ca2+-binding EF-hand superfamily protein